MTPAGAEEDKLWTTIDQKEKTHNYYYKYRRRETPSQTKEKEAGCDRLRKGCEYKITAVLLWRNTQECWEQHKKLVHCVCAAIMQQSSLRENRVTLQTAPMQNHSFWHGEKWSDCLFFLIWTYWSLLISHQSKRGFIFYPTTVSFGWISR